MEICNDARKTAMMTCFICLSFLCALCVSAVNTRSMPFLLHALQAVIRQPGCSCTGMIADYLG